MFTDRLKRMAEVERDLRQLGCWVHRDQAAGIYPEWHRHSGYELIWPFRGEGAIFTEIDRFFFGAGDILLLDGRRTHSLQVMGSPMDVLLLYFTPELAKAITPVCRRLFSCLETSYALALAPSPPAYRRISSWLEAMIDETKLALPTSNSALSSYLQLVLIETERETHERLASAAERNRRRSSGLVGQVISYITRHLTQRISLEQMGRELGASPRHLARVFKQETGDAPGEFWTRMKMEKARLELRNSGMTIAGVAADVGYASTAAFSRAFKRHFGVTPSHVRNVASVTDEFTPSANNWR